MRFPFPLLVLAASCSAPSVREVPPLTTAIPGPIAAASAPSPASAVCDEATAKLRDSMKDTSRAYALVKSLTDEVGPRLAGSPGDPLAVAWAARTMTALGLEPVRKEAVRVPRWERGEGRAELTQPVKHALAVTALGGSVATPAAGVEGEVVEVSSFAALEAIAPGSAKGKIVFLNVPTPRARDGSGYGVSVRGRLFGARHAETAGASAFVVRSAGTDVDRLPHTGTLVRGATPGVPAAALSVADAELLHRALEDRAPVRMRLVLTPRKMDDADSANVIGEIRGAEHPDEIVLLGAHLDSWDLGTGALDDGAGVAIVLDAAQAIVRSGARPKRTIRIVLFAAEENSGAGHDAYAKAHAGEVSSYVAALEADSGDGRAYELRYLGGADARPRFTALGACVGALGVALSNAPASGGADTRPLRLLGVPLVDLQQDETRYFDIHHTANDTLAKIDRAALEHTATAYAVTAWTLANMEGNLGRAPSP